MFNIKIFAHVLIETIKPYHKQETSKKDEVREMFDNISPAYDKINRVLSLGIDILWRRILVKMVVDQKPQLVMDLATGTGDLAIALRKKGIPKIVGVDLAPQMLHYGRLKIEKQKLNNIEMLVGDAENLPFDDNTFDSITISFGVRNFENTKEGLKEMLRVLKPNGKVYILEFSEPAPKPVLYLYNLYSRYLCPLIGRLLSKDPRAYTYLPESIKAFPKGKDFLKILSDCGYNKPQQKRLSFGISTIYSAQK